MIYQTQKNMFNPRFPNIEKRFENNAPINVKPRVGGGGGGGGGRPGIGGGVDVTSLPVVGTFDHSLSSFDQQ